VTTSTLEAPVTSPPIAPPARILIVDDDARNRTLLEILLASEGYQLSTATGGLDALAKVASQPPDLILLDVMMPGMDGYAVAERLKADAATCSIPIIMVTALDDRDARLRGLQAGAEDFVSKPVDGAELRVRVRNLARLRTADDVRYGVALAGAVTSRTADLLQRTEKLEAQASVLTERAAMLEQMRVDQLKFKNDFLSHVSHELRSPLTAIKQFTSILLAGLAGALTDEQQEYQRIVLRNVGQLQSMIDDLLEVTRLETGKLTIMSERVSLASAVADAVDTLRESARAKGVALSTNVSDDLPCASADRTRLRQIVIILLDNAIKFTPTGGAITVQAHATTPGRRLLECSVADTGSGIGTERATHIFERLYQAGDGMASSRKGLGLGLYICQELVQRQGGTIRAVDHAPLPGSTFTFTLPVFTLDDVVAPLLKNGRWPAESVSLLVIDATGPAAATSPESMEAWARDARHLLQRCVLPDLDVLLPDVRVDADRQRFFIAVFADASGVAILANRIRGQFDQIEQVNRAGVSVAVSVQPVPMPAQASDETTERRIAALAESLQLSMNAINKIADHDASLHHETP
jgi:signal transduction histidine kinase